MKRNIRVAMVMFLSQLLKVDINEQATLEIDYLREENQSLKFQFKKTRLGNLLKYYYREAA